MKKIIVIGCPGAGKSTFARALRDKIGLPLYYLDMIWHKEDKTNISREEFDEKLTEILETDNWIIDGNYSRTLEPRLKACDTVFFLDFKTKICLQGAKERVGKPREDMPYIENSFDEEFEKMIKRFNDTERSKIYTLIEKFKDKEIIIFKTRTELKNYLEVI